MVWNKIVLLTALVGLMACGSGGQMESTQPASANTTEASTESRQVILFLGNSITAGYGLSVEEAYPALIQQRLDSLGWAYRCVNAGISGETTAGGRDRIGWLLEQTPDIAVVVVALGGNDGLRAIDPANTYVNLQAIIQTIRRHDSNIRILLAGMEAPPNLGDTYTSAFRAVYPRLQQEMDVALLPFLLAGVAGEPALNQADGIHPTPEGQQKVAALVWAELAGLLE